MKTTELIFAILRVPLDYLMFVAAGIIAYSLRVTPQVRSVWPVLFEEELPFTRYFLLVSAASAMLLGIFALAGLYRVKQQKIPEEIFQIVIATSLGAMAIVLLIFFRQELFNSRFLIVASWALAVLFVVVARMCSRLLKGFLVSNFDFGIHKVLVIGDDTMSEIIIEEFKKKRGLGLRIYKQIPDIDMVQISRAISVPHVEEIILSSFEYPKDKILDLINFCHENRVTFRFAPNIFQTVTQHTEIDTLGGVPLVEIKRTRLEGWGRVTKRLMDVAIALFVMAVLAPVVVLIALLVKLDSPGPVFYKNKRVGPYGDLFVYKFRSMKLEYCTGEEYPNSVHASQYEDKIVQEKSTRQGPVFKVINDPRRTRIGKILERYSLDELPQFLNVLKGEMSIVGPRPHMPKEVKGYSRHHKRVFNVKPGITGLAQISGRSNLDFEEEVRFDTHYIENWSLLIDIIIMIKTPFIMVFGKHEQ